MERTVGRVWLPPEIKGWAESSVGASRKHEKINIVSGFCSWRSRKILGISIFYGNILSTSGAISTISGSTVIPASCVIHRPLGYTGYVLSFEYVDSRGSCQGEHQQQFFTNNNNGSCYSYFIPV